MSEAHSTLAVITAAEHWMRSLGPIVLGEEYLRAVARVEALATNRTGASKDWLERAVRTDDEFFAGLRRVR